MNGGRKEGFPPSRLISAAAPGPENPRDKADNVGRTSLNANSWNAPPLPSPLYGPARLLPLLFQAKAVAESAGEAGAAKALLFASSSSSSGTGECLPDLPSFPVEPRRQAKLALTDGAAPLLAATSILVRGIPASSSLPAAPTALANAAPFASEGSGRRRRAFHGSALVPASVLLREPGASGHGLKSGREQNRERERDQLRTAFPSQTGRVKGRR